MRSLAPLLLLAALVLPVACFAQAANDTPGIGKANHTVYIYAPYKWAFKRFDIDTPAIDYVNNGTRKPSGQQYDLMVLAEPNEPTADKPAMNCTVSKFRDLINKNGDNMGVLVISSHGSRGEFSVEPFGKDAGAAARRDARYNKYINDKEFTAQEISKTQSEDGASISVTRAFLEKYRQLSQALVYVGACEGNTVVPFFIGNKDAKPETVARAALGSTDCPKVFSSFGYATNFFSDLDGQPKPGRNDDMRLANRVVANAVTAENKQFEKLEISFVLGGKGATTLTPYVLEGRSFDFDCPLVAKTLKLTFDTNMDTTNLPMLDISNNIKLGQVKWDKNVLEVPVELVRAAANMRTYSFKLIGNSVKSAKNASSLDGNTNPPQEKQDSGPAVNAQGPANSKATPDDYLVKFDDCKRTH